MKEKIRGIMSSVLEVPFENITDNAARNNIENWDSMHHLLLILAIEEEFGVHFSDNEIVELVNLEAILAAMNKKIQI